MKKSSLSVSLLLVLSSPAFAQNVDQLKWMSGCWQTEANGRKVQESWNAPEALSMLGTSRTIAGGKTVTWEFMRIHDHDGAGLAFTASPANKPSATFPLKQIGADSVVFENPDHPFPQRVLYRADGPGKLMARIEGSINGVAKGFDFPYVRVKCE